MKYVLAFIISLMSLKASATTMEHHGIEYRHISGDRYELTFTRDDGTQQASTLRFRPNANYQTLPEYIEWYYNANYQYRDQSWARGFFESYDLDEDDVPDVQDPDIDGDGIENVEEPGRERDRDNDGVDDIDDSDIDGDGIENVDEADGQVRIPEGQEETQTPNTQGERGPEGPQGPQGERGERGQDGDDFNGNARLTHLETEVVPALKAAISYNTQRINENTNRINELDLRVNSYQAISGATDAAIGSIGGPSGLGIGTSTVNGIEAISMVVRQSFGNGVSIFGAATHSEKHEQYSAGVGISW